MLAWLLDTNRLRDASLEDAEQAARTASILRWFALQYPDVGGVTIERAAELETAAAERVSAKLAAEVRSPSVGRCKSCGQSCAPWFALCERCYGTAVAHRHGHRRRDHDAATMFGTISAQFPSAIPYESQSRKPTKSTVM